jgi:transcriptional regulator with XRE-family HTH domain
MSEPGSPDFASLLRRFRTEAALTQEELAERARVSVRAVSDLERGVITRPRPFTVRQLAEALELSQADQARFTVAAIPTIQGEDAEAVMPSGNFLGAQPVGPLIARDKDMDRVRAGLTAAAEGAGCFVLLEGERGVGITRLLQEVMLEALRRNCLVLSGQCYEIEQETPCFPLMTAFGGLGRQLPADRRGEAQRLWRRIQQRASARTERVEAGRRLAPPEVALNDGFSEMVAFAGEVAPLVLLLDGLHWCDRDSLNVLHHIARLATHSRVLIVGGFCDVDLMSKHPEFATTLLTLNRQRLVERITVRRLSLDESA